jgi:hypothetical protein
MGLGDLIHKAEKNISDEKNKIVSRANRTFSSLGTTIHQAETTVNKDIKNIGTVVKNDVKNTASFIQDQAYKLPDNLAKAGTYLENGALSIGDTISKLEEDALPSSNKIIMETGLVVLGIAAVCVVIVKFV